ncbi:MAG TPA: response regulator [Acidimicrobiia bacterium]|nr:response regulator [Acidimicrobiia bacterium]
MDFDTPELTQIFREELEERSRRLVMGARDLIAGNLSLDKVSDLVRDAHTIKGSAGLLGRKTISEAGAVLERMWRQVGEGNTPPTAALVAMEATAGRLVGSFDSGDESELREALTRLELAATQEPPEPRALRPPETSLGGLLTSMTGSVLGDATRVDTGQLYQLINRIVEVALDVDALADLSLVSIEGADPAVFRKTFRAQLMRLSESIQDVQGQAVALANVPFADAVSTFPQFVRYLGRRMGKDVRIEIEGLDIQIDRQIIDLIREPLRHLLVNAVDHGIEPPEERVAKGKPPTGTIRVTAEVQDHRVEISITDDGAGIDWDRVAEVADEKGIPVMPPDLSPVLFHHGFSTRTAKTEFSGAGDGLPLAREAVEKVRGALHISSHKGDGTTATMVLPMSMVLQNVVVVATGDEFWGIPEAAVEASLPLPAAEYTSADNGRTVSFRSRSIPCVSLALAVGAEEPEDETEMVVINTRSGLVAVTVSEIVDRRRVAVKSLGPILEGASHVTGAAMLGGGQVLVVLDPNFLGVVARQRPRSLSDRPRVLVVDDSAGVRQLLSATLTGAGFDVEVAAGAREAVLAMATSGFDALVVDYSMPRSNGVELVRAMRAADIRVPIVMVSGVASDEEKRAAWDAGVDAYLDKFDLRQGVLTQTLRRLLGMNAADSA